MSAAELEAAMADMEAARAAFAATTSRVGAELSRLQERVNTANAKASGERAQIAEEARKRRRLAGGAAANGNNPDAAAEAAFRDSARVFISAMIRMLCRWIKRFLTLKLSFIV